MRVRDVAEVTGLGLSTVRSMLIPLLKNSRAVKGKFRRHNFCLPGSKKPLVLVVKADVDAVFPSPQEILARRAA